MRADFGRYSCGFSQDRDEAVLRIKGPVMNGGASDSGTWFVPTEMRRDMARMLRFLAEALEEME